MRIDMAVLKKLVVIGFVCSFLFVVGINLDGRWGIGMPGFVAGFGQESVEKDVELATRLTIPDAPGDLTAWQLVSELKKRAGEGFVQIESPAGSEATAAKFSYSGELNIGEVVEKYFLDSRWRGSEAVDSMTMDRFRVFRRGRQIVYFGENKTESSAIEGVILVFAIGSGR